MIKLKDRKKTEKEIMAEIRVWLNFKGIWHYKQWQGLGSLHGISDIIGILNSPGYGYGGKYLAIEVKRKGAKLSDKQEQFLNRVRVEGGIGLVCYSVEDLVVQLREFGVRDK